MFIKQIKGIVFSRLADPYFIAAFILYGLALTGSAIVSGSWWSAMLLGFGVALLSGIVLVVTNKQRPHVTTACSQFQLWSMLIWYGLVILLAVVTLARGLELVNGFTNWFFLVLVPVGLLALKRRHDTSVRDMLHSAGLTRTGMKDALKLVVLLVPLSIPLLYIVGDQQRAAIQMIFNTPRLAVAPFLVSFVLALLTAGFVEEFFFRGILQSRLAACLSSEWHGLLVAAFLFGLLHLPLYFYSSFEPTQGNLVWAVASVITEPTILGILLGVVWIRTRNLIAPVLLHAFINSFAMMTTLKIGAG